MRKDIVCGLNYRIISHSRNAEDFDTDLDNQETYKKNARSTKALSTRKQTQKSMMFFRSGERQLILKNVYPKHQNISLHPGGWKLKDFSPENNDVKYQTMTI